MADLLKKSVPPKTEAKPKETPERPEIAQFLKWQRDGIKIHWQLLDGSTVIGTLNWFDQYTVQVKTDGMGDVTIPKHSILWYREATEP